jgi:hypothetical protein
MQKPTCFHNCGHMDSSVAFFNTIMSSLATYAFAVASTIAVTALASIVVLTTVTSSYSTTTTAASFSAGLVLLITPTLLVVPVMVSNVGCLLDVFLQRHLELPPKKAK